MAENTVLNGDCVYSKKDSNPPHSLEGDGGGGGKGPGNFKSYLCIYAIFMPFHPQTARAMRGLADGADTPTVGPTNQMHSSTETQTG